MAKDTIGSMTAVVRATAGAFDNDVKQIGGSVNRLKQQVDSAQPSGGGVFGMFAAGGAIGAGIAAAQGAIAALTGTVQKFFDTISQADDLGDFAERIGSTASELSGLHFAADLLGSSSEALDAGLQKMVQKIGEARQGAESAATPFAALGLSVDELSQMSAGDALKAIADGFQGITNPADRAALAVDLFGKQGINLVTALEGGSAAIDQMIARGEDLGAVLSDEDVAAMAAAKDAIDEMKAAWQGLGNELTVLIVPVLKVVVEGITEVISWINAMIQGIKDLLEWLGLMSEKTAKASKPNVAGSSLVAELNAEKKAQAAAAKEQERAAAEAQRAMDDLMRKGAQLAQQMRTPMEVFNDTLADTAKLLSVNAIDWKTYERAVNEAAETLRKAEESKADKFQPTEAVGAALRGTSEGFSAVQSGVRQQMDAERLRDQRQQQQLAEERRHTALLQAINASLGRDKETTAAADI